MKVYVYVGEPSDASKAPRVWATCQSCGTELPRKRKWCVDCARERTKAAVVAYRKRNPQKMAEWARRNAERKGCRPWQVYLQDARKRRDELAPRVVELRTTGMKFKQIGDALGITKNAAVGLWHRYHGAR